MLTDGGEAGLEGTCGAGPLVAVILTALPLTPATTLLVLLPPLLFTPLLQLPLLLLSPPLLLLFSPLLLLPPVAAPGTTRLLALFLKSNPELFEDDVLSLL